MCAVIVVKLFHFLPPGKSADDGRDPRNTQKVHKPTRQREKVCEEKMPKARAKTSVRKSSQRSKSRKAPRRNASAGNRVKVVIEEKDHPVLLPAPLMHSKIVDSVRQDGLSIQDAGQNVLGLHSVLTSAHDKFQLAVLRSLFEPTRPYPIPGIRKAGMFGPDTTETYSSGVVELNDFITKRAEARGTTIHYTNPIEESVIMGRYARFNGRCVTTYTFNTNSNGEGEYWIFHDPTELDYPIVALDMTTNPSPNYTKLVVAARTQWTSNPYPLARSYSSELGDHAVENQDNASLYFTGSAVLAVSTLNKTSYMSTAYQVRTGDNVIDRMYDQVDFYNGTSAADNAGWTDTTTEGMGAISMYNGESWRVGTAFINTVSDPDDIKFWASHLLNRCWVMGAPFVRVVVRTNNAGTPASSTVQFSVALNVWTCTAPIDVKVAGGMPLETVPFPSPTWLRAVKTRGAVATDSRMDKAFQAAARKAASRIPEGILGTTPFERMLAAKPAKVIEHAMKTETSEKSAGNSNGFLSFLDKVANMVPSIISGIDKLGTIGSVALSLI